jgi:activator of 2-hydroxyglutaryl-CoA dehydratase
VTPSPRVLRAGIDVGSTTVKLAILDAEDQLLYGSYERHKADIRGTLISVMDAAHDAIAARGEDLSVTVAVTG